MRENQAEDERCLANVEELIEKQAKLGIPVAGMMVEPIQAEGGDYHGSKEFFQVSDMVEERAFAIELVILFIVFKTHARFDLSFTAFIL